MVRYDRADLVEMEAVYAGYELAFARKKLEFIRKGITREEQVKLAEAEVELAEIRVYLVGVKVDMEVLARNRSRPLPRKEVAAIEREMHTAMVKLRSLLGRV